MRSDWNPDSPTPITANRRRFTLSWNIKVLLSVLLTVVIIGLSVWSGLIVTSAHFGQESYQDGRLETAERHYQTNMRVTPDAWEGWEPPFNRGTARLRLGVDADAVGVGPGGFSGSQGSGGEVIYHAISNVAMIDAGVVDVELALTRVPEAEREKGQVTDPNSEPECMVRRNLSIGQELQGDWFVTSGDSRGAAKKYALAQETLAPCQESDENQDQSERQKRKEQENEQDGEGSGDSDGSEGSDGGLDGSGNEPNEGGSDGPSGGESNDQSDGSGSGSGGDLDPNMQGKEEQLRDRNRRGQGDYDDQQNQNYGGGMNW